MDFRASLLCTFKVGCEEALSCEMRTFRPFFSRKRFGSSNDTMAVTSRRARDDDLDRGDASSALPRGGPAHYDLRDPR